MLHWEFSGVKYKIKLKEPVDSAIIKELGIPEHIYKAPEDTDKHGATLLELAAALGQTRCVEVLLDLGFQMSYNPIVKKWSAGDWKSTAMSWHFPRLNFRVQNHYLCSIVAQATGKNNRLLTAE